VLQTKGVKSIVSIEPANAAWYSAVGGVGAGLVGTLAVWPFMRKLVRQYDEQNSLPKDADVANYKTSGIEEDRWVTVPMSLPCRDPTACVTKACHSSVRLHVSYGTMLYA